MTKTNLQTATATTARQWQILSQLERKRWLGTQYINEQLQLIGFDVSIRTIQRDLNALAERFPIEKNNANPQGWRWQEDAPMQSLPHMNLSQAVAFSMVKDNLTQLLPPAVLDELLPWFDLAKRQLKESKIANTWLDRVRILSANQPLIPPNVDNDAKEAIYEALFKNKQLSVKYKKRGGDEAVDYRLNPLAIVQRGVVIYLLATRDDADANIRQFALHRFSQAVVSDSDAKGVADFDLDKYIETGAMGFNFPLFNSLKTEQNQGKPTCDVHLIFEPIAGNGLLESQLSHDQQTWEDEQGLHVTATLMLTSQLVWWLRGFGKGLRSVSPEILAMAVFENA
ncbi:helix-turn-helix transcriptional regulator [Faucicola boevrei]|uniref:helix-turn-helix transcriptional regulator n=1 Tax=Faucicola boevrei TaxID=346665 RepID=UPI00058D9CF6|nr:WYL domain-containing protein [Moraxella boevrei]